MLKSKVKKLLFSVGRICPIVCGKFVMNFESANITIFNYYNFIFMNITYVHEVP
jgi:hypothetical protein